MGMVWVMTRATDVELAQLKANPDDVDDFINSDVAYESGRGVDLDKHWHAIHFLLTGSAEPTDSPLSLILGGFEEIGPDNGYGPAWIVPKEALIAFNDALSTRTDEQWIAGYDAAAAVKAQVYIAEALLNEGDEALEFLAEDLKRLREFVAAAVADGDNAFAVIS